MFLAVPNHTNKLNTNACIVCVLIAFFPALRILCALHVCVYVCVCVCACVCVCLQITYAPSFTGNLLSAMGCVWMIVLYPNDERGSWTNKSVIPIIACTVYI